MKFDDIIVQLGQFGPYQRRVQVLVCIASMAIAMQTFGPVFTMATPEHRCAVLSLVDDDTYMGVNSSQSAVIREAIPPGDDHLDYSPCKTWKTQSQGHNFSQPIEYLNVTRSCKKWVYDTTDYESTLISKFDLVCENKLGRAHVQMFFMLGCMLGTLLLGPAADYFGRKKVLMVSILIHLASSIAITFTPSFSLLCVFTMTNGLATVSIYCVLFVIGMEFVGPQKRVYAGYMIVVFYGVGVCVLVGLAYFIRHWQHLQLAITSISVIFIAYYWLMPESPRWLVNQGRYKEAEDILRKAAKVNNRQLSLKTFQWDTLETEAVHEPVWYIVKYPTLFMRTLVIFFNWLVCSMTYYGISMNVADLAGSIYLNMLLYGVVEALGTLACIVLLEKLGRRRLHLICMFVAGVCCTASPFPTLFLDGDYTWLSILLAVLGKAGVSAAFATIWLYTAELFPTVVRSGGVSASSFCARLGAVIAPYIANLSVSVGGTVGSALPLLIFGVASLIAGSLAMILPETSNRTLPDTLYDANRFGSSTEKISKQVPTDEEELKSFKPLTL